MASKNHPISFRLKQHKITDSLWYARYNYQSVLHDDLMIREIVQYTYKKNKTYVNQILIRRHLKVLFVVIYMYDYRARVKKRRLRFLRKKSKIKKKLLKYKKTKNFKAYRKILKQQKRLKKKKSLKHKKSIKVKKRFNLKKRKKRRKALKLLAKKKRKKRLTFENKIAKMIQKYCNIFDQKIQIISYDYSKIYNFRRHKIVKMVTKMVRYYKWIKNFKKLIELAFISIQTQNTTAFCNCLALVLKTKKLKDQRRIVLFSRSLFKGYSRFFLHFIGFKIMIKGRLRGRLRAKKFMVKYGFIPLQTIAAVIHYNFKPMHSKFGTFGFRLWFCYTSSTNFQIDYLNRWQDYLKKLREKGLDEEKQLKNKLLPIPINNSAYLSKQMLQKASTFTNILLNSSFSKDPKTMSMLKLRSIKNLKVAKKQNVLLKLNISDILLWHFLYKYFFKKHKKYPALYFFDILNCVIKSSENKYKQFLIKKHFLKFVIIYSLKKKIVR